ncbi:MULTISPECIES: hypothetical protein [Acidobacterium]|uniref:hypothetical protein n=1 Tax=Acidobacterium TaxID=33973 RepID=UPI0002DBB441|nr:MULTISPECIES: hypothetical protein [Acidobacterium]HCT59727.1 hypothetical protein [Acidobacterium sp.]
MKLRSSPPPSAPAHPALDAALRQLGTATPDPQMQERLLRRLRTAALTDAAPQSGLRWPRFAAAALAGSFACALIVTGSLAHSHTVAERQAGPPMLEIVRPQSGVSTASAAHITAHPVPAPGKGRAHEQMTPGVHTRQGLALPQKISSQ